MWTIRILKSAATIAIISAFTQAHAGENATCYVVKDSKTTPVACTKNVVETHKKGSLKVCRTSLVSRASDGQLSLLVLWAKNCVPNALVLSKAFAPQQGILNTCCLYSHFNLIHCSGEK